MQLTLPEIPEQLGDALRQRAKAEGKTVDQIALEAVMAYADSSIGAQKRDLSFMGNLSREDAKAIEQAHEFCDQIGLIGEPTK
jgi:hypothetical protein